MLQSQISCNTFLCFSQPIPLWHCIMETRDIPKELGLFYVALLTVLLYIQWEQFNIFQVTLPTPSHQVTSNFMSFFQGLHMKLLNIVTLLTWGSFLEITLPFSKIYWISSNINFQIQPSNRQKYYFTNFLWTFKTKNVSTYSSAFWSCLYYHTKNNVKKRPQGRSIRKSSWLRITLPHFSLDQGN